LRNCCSGWTKRSSIGWAVIVDEASGRAGRGRTKWDAPEIDGGVHLTGRLPIRAGEIVTARITGSSEYDLIGEIA
jgi:ribosomal protein S12 methylthiotransferase